MRVVAAITCMATMPDMVTRNDTGGVRLSALHYLTRGFVCLFGIAAIAWGLFVLPIFSQSASSESLASRLLSDDTFKLQLILTEVQQAQKAADRPFCVPTALRSLFILRLFALNKAIAES